MPRMKQFAIVTTLLGSGATLFAQTPASGPAAATVQLAPGTTLPLIVIRPLPRKNAAAHDLVYTQTLAPVVQNGQVLVPAGTQLQGEIEAVTQPGFFHAHARVTIHFPQAVLSGTYVVPLDDELRGLRENARLLLAVTIANEFLLDTGTTFDLPLRIEPKIDLARLTTNGTAPGILPSSSRCKPTASIPGTPGTPDTVIPGTPGTPDTILPGVDGGAPTIIPGTPPTPPTVIPGMVGTPGTPGSVCPSAPRVKSVVLVP